MSFLQKHRRILFLVIVCGSAALLCFVGSRLLPERGPAPGKPDRTEAWRRAVAGEDPPPYDQEKHLAELREKLRHMEPETPPVVFTPAEELVRHYRTREPDKTWTNDMALADLEAILQRDDLTDELRIYAWWRVGALNSYNIDPENGWPPDWNKAAAAFQKALAVRPELVSFETINAAITLATILGEPMDRADRLVEGYTWLLTRTDEMVVRSAEHLELPTTPEGILGKKFFPGSYPPVLPPEQRQAALAARLAETRETMDEWMPHFVTVTPPTAANHALTQLATMAPPDKIALWRSTLEAKNVFMKRQAKPALPEAETASEP